MNDNHSQLANLERQWLMGHPVHISTAYMSTRIKIQCDEFAIQRLRSVLKVISEDIIWVDADCRSKFPLWFLGNFKPEESDEEVMRRMTTWRRLPDADKPFFLEKAGWSFEQWIYWLHPDNRMWYVADVRHHNEDFYNITVLFVDWPTPVRALTWLLKTCGGANVEFLKYE